MRASKIILEHVHFGFIAQRRPLFCGEQRKKIRRMIAKKKVVKYWGIFDNFFPAQNHGQIVHLAV